MTATVNERMSFKNDIPLSESFARKVLDASLNGIYVYDVTLGKNVFINSRYTKITGYTTADLKKLSKTQFFDLFHPEDRGLVTEHMEKLFLTGDENLEIEYRFKTKDGIWIWCLSRDSVIYRDHYGTVSHFVGTFLDITNRKESERTLRESETRYKGLVQNANSAIIRWRCDGTISFFNEYAQSFFGYSTEEVIGRNVSILLPQRDSEGDDLTGLIQDIVDNPQDYIKNINENICRDGRRVWMAWTNKAILDQCGQAVEILAVGTDVTEQKRMEEALKKSNQELTEYSYALTHNLKAPIRAVHNYVDFLLEDLGDTLEEKPKSYLEGMKKAIIQSDKQFKDLETLYHIKNHLMSVEPFDMRELLEEIKSTFNGTPAQELIITHPQWPVFRGEKFLLRQILNNLINNGFKFNSADIKRAEIGWQPSTDNRIEIFVRDNGIGIEPQYHEQIFQLFQRLHTESQYEGTGIGLAIVKRAAQRIGGTLRVESAIGKGSTFYVILPSSILEVNRQEKLYANSRLFLEP
jgi:PAS domain S-box-containing protein